MYHSFKVLSTLGWSMIFIIWCSMVATYKFTSACVYKLFKHGHEIVSVLRLWVILIHVVLRIILFCGCSMVAHDNFYMNV